MTVVLFDAEHSGEPDQRRVVGEDADDVGAPTDFFVEGLELKAGMPSRRGQKGTAAAYSLKDVREREKALAEQAERACTQMVADWQAKAPRKPALAPGGGIALAREGR
jgi:hypothetical protein